MLKEISENSQNPFAKCIAYEVDNKVVGTLRYSYIYDRIEIDNIFVEEECRNKGIATKMMEKLLSIATTNKVVNITLEVRVSNAIAINLYKKFGFNKVAIRKFYYGDEDAILMEKQVM